MGVLIGLAAVLTLFVSAPWWWDSWRRLVLAVWLVAVALLAARGAVVLGWLP